MTKKDSLPSVLGQCVEQELRKYFTYLKGEMVTNIYPMILGEVDSALLKVVMDYTKGNQTKAAQYLGLNRATLRKKLRQYGLIDG